MAESPFGFQRPEESPGFLLWQTTITWQRLIKAVLEPHNVSHAQFVIMALLLWFEENHYDTTQISIVNLSKLDKMTVSQALKKLGIQGLVVRVEHATDTRAKSASLTENGRSLIRRLIPLVERVDAEFFSIISDENQQSLLQILRALGNGDNT